MKYFLQASASIVLLSGALSAIAAHHPWTTANVGPIPIIVQPTPSHISAGQSSSVAVTLDKTSASSTTVFLVSSHPQIVAVPSSLVIPAGHLSGNFSADAVVDAAPAASTLVTITAWTSDGAQYGEITVQ